MSAQASYIFIDFDTLSITVDNVPYNVDSSHHNWDDIIVALKAGDFAAIPELINEAKQIVIFAGTSGISVNAEYGTITYHGVEIHNTLVEHIFRMKDEGFDINPMVRFLDNLMQNPAKRAVDELYSFLQAGKMPITEDGCFIAYKRVRDNYRSTHDGKTINTPYDKMTAEDLRLLPHTYNGTTTSVENGVTVLSMPRNMVNENSNQTCSFGLHFCSQGYLNHFSGERIVILKVNPRDVVSIPADYNDTKGRACRYEIVGELTVEQKQKALESNIFTQAVHNGIEEAKKAAVPTGAKLTQGYFGKGYVAGYRAMEEDTGYEDWASDNCSCGQQDAYSDGYAQGWDDAADGEEMRFTTREYEASKGLQPEGAVPQVVARTTSAMYEQGFKDGRAHRAKQYYTDAEYLRGYKDARSK